jgi:hypothetical protein
MQATRLVVIAAGVGENVLWGPTQAVRTLEPQKLLILVLEMKAEDYESFRTKANPIFGVSLPDQAFSRGLGFRRVSGFISFAADWKPSFLALKGPYFRSGSLKRLAKYALRPVFESFGLEWQPPSISVGQIGWLIPFVGLGVVALVAGIITVNGLLLALVHGVECGIWAVAYLWLGALDSPLDALLFSVDSMSTRGASGLTLQRHWQLMGALEAVNGMLVFGVSTACLFTLGQVYISRRTAMPDEL